ncbi:hypothetical protein WT21_28655 [Burkholderia territorii]|uniref:hypothetical protein n=1 Tax=Burkholderia territorii TaxID=1503055 RepID=UPI00075C3AFF|nr:hypothetical protein [Burkholderia territorii]KVL33825.1 hypothetical protein WS97_19400 [Burkholderia territorii]KVL46984.1 hypothetical protein WT00_25375 [Burkholderia territorii]KVQ40066.1 hypothetical protein WT21_28655 [Burkholderia territorii]KVT82237.1 hypothetical protein WT25_14935 [Burkholderia territorii]KWE33348.1 hypothetical protein WT49_18020 [Burkholderia territorii]
MVRLFGCGLLALSFASTGWAAEHYVEVWNPPEARSPAAHAQARTPDARTPDARTPAARPGADVHAGGKTVEKHASVQPKAAVKLHKRRVAQAVKTAPRRPAAATVDAPAAPRPVTQPAPGRLTVMQPALPDTPHALTFPDIPRQYTPDGNVLRVGTRSRSAEVTR